MQANLYITGFNDAWLYEDGTTVKSDTLNVVSSGQLRVEYKKQMFLNYDKEDTRRDATFLSVYEQDTKELSGLILRKNLGVYKLWRRNLVQPFVGISSFGRS